MKKQQTKNQKQEEKTLQTKISKSNNIYDKIAKTPNQIILLLIFVFVIYGQSIFYSFTYFDDNFLILNNQINLQSLTNIKSAFLEDSFLHKGVQQFYRPLQTVTYIIDTVISDSSPAMYHFTNLLLFFCGCLAVFYLVNKIKQNRIIALIVSIIYSIHPIFVHAVAWLPSRGDLLVFLFVTLAFINFINYFESSKIKYLLLLFLMYLFAMFSKETAIILPIVSYLYLIIKKNNKFKEIIFSILAFLIPTVFWYYMRSMVIKHEYLSELNFGINSLIHNLRVFPEILAKFLLPFNIAVMPSFSIILTIIGLAILLLLMYYIIIKKSYRINNIVLGLLWFIGFTLPGLIYQRVYSNIYYDYLDHRNLIPLIGILIVLIEIIPTKVFNLTIKRNRIIITIIIIILSVISFINVKSYKNPVTFYTRAIESNPDKAMLYFNRAIYYRDIENYQLSLMDYNKAIELYPDFAEAYSNRAAILEYNNNFVEALNDCNKAIAIKPDYLDAIINRANIKLNMEDYTGAIPDFNLAIKMSPFDAILYHDRGLVYYNIKDFNNALIDFNKAISLQKDFTSAYYNCANIYYTIGDKKNALVYYNHTLRINPNNVNAINNRAWLKYEMNDYDGAINDYNQAVIIQPNYSKAYYNRALAKQAKGDIKAAIIDWNEAARLGNNAAKEMINKYSK